MPRKNDQPQHQQPYIAINNAALPFDESGYKCCCGCCHIRTAAIFIAFIDLLLLGTHFSVLVEIYTTVQQYRSVALTLVVLAVFVLFIWSVVAALMVVLAVCRTQPDWLLPKLVMHLVTTVVFICVIVFAVYYFSGAKERVNRIFKGMIEEMDNSDLASRDEEEVETWLSTGVALAGVGSLLVAGVELWFLTVVRKCHLYLKTKRRYLISVGAITEDAGPGLTQADIPMAPLDAGGSQPYEQPPAYHAGGQQPSAPPAKS